MTKLKLAKSHSQHFKKLNVLMLLRKLRQKYGLLGLQDLYLSLVSFL